MERKSEVGHLEMAERHVAEGEQHLARQRKLIAELERDGHDTALAIELLHEFERTQASHIEERDRIRAELSGSPKRAD
jgi:hypothetical protein